MLLCETPDFWGSWKYIWDMVCAWKWPMLYKSLGHLCGCDGTFLFPQANGHVSQDQEEPIYSESTARAPAEDETQVGPLLGSVPLPLPFHCS